MPDGHSWNKKENKKKKEKVKQVKDIPFVSWKIVFKSQIPERSYSIRNVDPEF